MLLQPKPPKSGLRPPEGFRGAGEVKWAHLLSGPPAFVRRGSRRGARGRGIRYEEKLQRALDRLYGFSYVPSPWACFYNGEVRYCQPDGLLLDVERGLITIVEAKFNHTAAAYWGLFNLYLPVVRAIFGADWRYACCEVVRWYDPEVYGPMDCTLRRKIELTRPGEWGVTIWNEKD